MTPDPEAFDFSQRPFIVNRWESPNPPPLEILTRWFSREKLSHEEEIFAPGAPTPELKFPTQTVRTVVSGTLQCAFPGYGVLELKAGDSVEIQADTRHDLKAMGKDPVILLKAFRPNSD